MSLLESEETLSEVEQFKEKIETQHNTVDKANKELKLLRKELQSKQETLKDLRENLQEQDSDALELLEKLYQQQEKIKGHLTTQSADEIRQAIQAQNELIDSKLELNTQEYENILSHLELCQKLQRFLSEDGQDISYMGMEHQFAHLLKDNKKEDLLEKNSQLIAELNGKMQNLQEKESYLIEQKNKLQKKDLADDLIVDADPELQKLFEYRQAEIKKEIDVILEENAVTKEQYNTVKLQEEEIKKIQDQIEQKIQIIEQNKQQEEQLIGGLEQFEQKVSSTLSNTKQQKEAPLSYHSILQERAADGAVELKRQIELNKLHTELSAAQEKINDQASLLKELDLLRNEEKLFANQEIENHLASIRSLQERIKELEKEERQTKQQDTSLFDELKFPDLESRINTLTKENDNLQTQLEKVRENEQKQIAILSEAKEHDATTIQTLNEELSQLKSEQKERQKELDKAKEELTDINKKLLESEKLQGEESKQTKNLRNQLEQLSTELKETKESEAKALTKEEATNLKLQAAEVEYAAIVKEQSVDALKLQTISEELSKLTLEQKESQKELVKKQQILDKSQEELLLAHDQFKEKSELTEKLQNQLKANGKLLTKVQQELGSEKITSKEKDEELKAKLSELTKVQTENKDLQAQLQIERSKLGTVSAKLEALSTQSKQTEIELQESRSELDEKQQLLEKSQKDLLQEQKKSKETTQLVQALEAKLFELTKVHTENKDLQTQLQIEKNTKKQLETLSAEKELKYNSLKEEQNTNMEKLYEELKKAEQHNRIMQDREQAVIEKLQDKDVRVEDLEAQNAALLSQLERLQIKPEVLGVAVQTDKIDSKSITTETEIVAKELKEVDTQTDNKQKLYQSVGTEYVPMMDSSVSVDTILSQHTDTTNIYDDDKILEAFKELSRKQVQPIVNKLALESTSSFAQLSQEHVAKLSEAFQNKKVLQEINNIEQKGYAEIHKRFSTEYKDIAWQGKGVEKSFSLQQNGKDVVTINETTLTHDDKNAKYETSEGEEIKNARRVHIPLSIDMKGACHMSFAVRDINGRNISKGDAVYLTAHYKNGKLVHLTKPTEIFSCSDDDESPLYLKRNGKTYTLPVDKSTLEQLEKEVLKNKGEYVGIVKNAKGNIVVNSATIHRLQADCVTSDPLFKDASRVLHDVKVTAAIKGSLDRKGPAHKKPEKTVMSK